MRGGLQGRNRSRSRLAINNIYQHSLWPRRARGSVCVFVCARARVHKRVRVQMCRNGLLKAQLSIRMIYKQTNFEHLFVSLSQCALVRYVFVARRFGTEPGSVRFCGALLRYAFVMPLRCLFVVSFVVRFAVRSVERSVVHLPVRSKKPCRLSVQQKHKHKRNRT